MPSPTPARTPAPKAPKPPSPRTGLLLTGGGARAAYQMGVLEAIADLRQACGAGREPNPFPIITGTSAGAPPRWPAALMISTAPCAASPAYGASSMRTRCMAPTRSR